MNNIRKLIKGEVTIQELRSYFTGNYRYFFYYKDLLKKYILRKFIREQIEYRIKWMDRMCYDRGTCKLCGCMVTALQMADRSCDMPCYPPMMNKAQWDAYKQRYQQSFDGGNTIWVMDEDGKPGYYKQQKDTSYVRYN